MMCVRELVILSYTRQRNLLTSVDITKVRRGRKAEAFTGKGRKGGEGKGRGGNEGREGEGRKKVKGMGRKKEETGGEGSCDKEGRSSGG